MSLPPAPPPAAHTPCDPNAKPPETCPGGIPCPKSGVCPTPTPPPPPGPPTPPKPKPPPPPPANQTCIDKNHTMWTCVCGGWSSTQFDCDLDCHCGQKCTKVCCKTEWCKNGSVALPPADGQVPPPPPPPPAPRYICGEACPPCRPTCIMCSASRPQAIAAEFSKGDKNDTAPVMPPAPPPACIGTTYTDPKCKGVCPPPIQPYTMHASGVATTVAEAGNQGGS